MRWFTRTTLLQLVIGPLFLITLPREVMLSLMGGDMLNTIMLLVGLAGVALVLYLGIRRKLWATVWTLGALVLVMSVMRALVRIEYLAPHYLVSQAEVAPQYGAFALFAVSLVIGLVIVGWVLKQALAVPLADETGNVKEG